MNKSIISLVLLLSCVFTVTGRDRLYIEDFNIKAGETLQIPVLLRNDTAYSGLQTDLYLPAGLTLDMEDDEYIIDPTSRESNSHTIVSNQLSNGAIRVYISSVSAREFTGNNGAIMTLSITANNNFTGPAFIELKNSVCAEALGTRHVLRNEVCYVNYYLKGDVNGDHEVNIADINAIIDIILGSTVNPKIMERADVNGDGEVNIADVNVVIDVILSE